jgi:hypothetical protein
MILNREGAEIMESITIIHVCSSPLFMLFIIAQARNVFGDDKKNRRYGR